MSSNYQSVSTQQFADQMFSHKEMMFEKLSAILPPYLADKAHSAHINTRSLLNFKSEDMAVIFGEQTYGLNEPPKVIGKRLFAKALEKYGIKTVELFASLDVAGSEGGIYRMQIPHPNTPDGYVALNTLPRWKKGKNVATTGYRSPRVEVLSSTFATLTGVYGLAKADAFKTFLSKFYNGRNNYAEANIHILRDFEKQIGLGIENWITEDILDTQIAKNGGMEVMLYLWPKIVETSTNHPFDGVRTPKIDETPFHLYHTQDNCWGRMETNFKNSEKPLNMETKIEAVCMHCGYREITTPLDIVFSGRPITWRAIPRIIAYSAFGIADCHITGGGSIYNIVVQFVSKDLGIPHFPTTHMLRLDSNWNTVFVYQSSAINKGKFLEEAKSFVASGKAAMADLLLSVGVDNLRVAIDETLKDKVNTTSRVICPSPLSKNSKVIN